MDFGDSPGTQLAVRGIGFYRRNVTDPLEHLNDMLANRTATINDALAVPLGHYVKAGLRADSVMSLPLAPRHVTASDFTTCQWAFEPDRVLRAAGVPVPPRFGLV